MTLVSPSRFRRIAAPGADPQQLQDGLAEWVEQLNRQQAKPFGTPTDVKVGDYTAKLGELVLVNPEGGQVTISLPKCYRSDTGAGVTVKNYSSTSTIVNLAPVVGGATIDQFAQNRQIIAGFGAVTAVVVGEDEWAIVSNNLAGATDPFWQYLDLVRPDGVTTDPKVLYQFDGSADSLNDRGPNGVDLSVDAGTAKYCRYFDYLVGYSSTEENFLKSNVSSHVQISGALTIEVMFDQAVITGSQDWLIETRAANLTVEADNPLYLCGIEGYNTLQSEGRFTFGWYNGTVNPERHDFDSCHPGKIQHVIYARDSSGNFAIYQQGELVEEASLTAPTGGTNTYLKIGDRFVGTMFSVRIWDVEFTAAQARESYLHLRGLA